MTSTAKRHGLFGTFILSGAILAAALAVAGPAQAAMIGVHWSYYNQYNGGVSSPTGVSNVVEPDGVLSQSNWNNVGTKWGNTDGGNTGLKNDSGNPTTAAVGIAATGAGTCWWVSGPATGLSNLLVGPWGGNGGGRVNVITDIPYANYDIIGYVNQPYGGNMNAWLDGNPGSPAQSNAHAAGSDYYFSPTEGSPGFVQITNTTPGTYPAGNYVVWSGLSGTSQALWVDVVGLSGGAYSDYNRMISGFQVVEVPEPSTVVLIIAGVFGLLACVWRRQRAA
jgi:hypothetical protein